MSNDIELGGVPQGCVIVAYDFSASFYNRMLHALMDRPDLSIIFARRYLGAMVKDARGFSVLNRQDAEEFCKASVQHDADEMARYRSMMQAWSS